MTTTTIPSAPDGGLAFKAGAMTAAREVSIIDVTAPAPGPGEAIVRVDASAICTWEQRTYSGVQHNTFPFIGGHEVAGTVTELPAGYVGSLVVGSRVALGNNSCGSCHWCATGQEGACAEHDKFAVRYPEAWGPGGFAEYKVHRADALFDIGDAPATHGALAEPLACALHAARMAAPAVGSDAVVIGAGFMGIMNVIALKARGARVIVTEMSAPRLELARAFGADEVVDASQVDAVEAVMALTDGRGAQTVVTAIGHASANEQGLAMLSHRGSLVLFASAHPEEPIEVSPNFLHKTEQRLVGALSKDKQDFHTAVRMIRHGLVDLEPLIQGAFGLGELEQALDLALEPHTYRVLVTP